MWLLRYRPQATTLLKMQAFKLAFTSPTALPQLTNRAHATSAFTPRPPLCSPHAVPRHRTHDQPHRKQYATASAGDIVIAGGSGFVGTRLANALLARGQPVTILTRNSAASLPAGAKPFVWPADPADTSDLQHCLAGARAVINLCGRPIATRWSAATREDIVQSRLRSTQALVSAISALGAPDRPDVLVSASGVGFYGFAMPYDARCEEDAPPGDDFLADLSRRWEEMAAGVQKAGVRSVSLRLGIVLGGEGGALAKMIPAFQLFLGGSLGSGRQWVSWVHVDDAVSGFIKAVEDGGMSGAYNCVAPKAVTMTDFCSALAGALKRPSLFPVPELVLKLALGEASCVLLEGQNAVPKRLSEAGFKFEYGDIDSAMRAVVRQL